MKRIGYDADTMIYTFRDEKGKIYHGPPGSDYGILTPVSHRQSRPEAFDSGHIIWVHCNFELIRMCQEDRQVH